MAPTATNCLRNAGVVLERCSNVFRAKSWATSEPEASRRTRGRIGAAASSSVRVSTLVAMACNASTAHSCVFVEPAARHSTRGGMAPALTTDLASLEARFVSTMAACIFRSSEPPAARNMRTREAMTPPAAAIRAWLVSSSQEIWNSAEDAANCMSLESASRGSSDAPGVLRSSDFSSQGSVHGEIETRSKFEIQILESKRGTQRRQVQYMELYVSNRRARIPTSELGRKVRIQQLQSVRNSTKV